MAIAAASPGALAQAPVGDVYASDASVRGSVYVVGSGTRVLSGSTISAGLAPATLQLARGGSVRVCPGTNVAVSMSPSGRSLSLGFNTGAVELNYDLVTSADTIQTSDFRMLLTGPGSYHIAVSADGLGNACVRPLGNNTASVIVSELFGDATYQVKPGEPVVFPKGKIAGLSHEPPPDCGCPEPSQTKVASEPSTQPSGQTAPLKPTEGLGGQPPDAPATPAITTEKQVLSVEAPLTYHADPAIPEPPQVALVSISGRAPALALLPTVLPPSATNETTNPPGAASKSVMGRIRSFFASLLK